MKIDYKVSLWNYTHYSCRPNINDLIIELGNRGLGIELWLFSEAYGDLTSGSKREELKEIFAGNIFPPSIHCVQTGSFSDLETQLEVASEFGTEVFVVHTDHLRIFDETSDLGYAHAIIDQAKEKNIVVALENGLIPYLSYAVEHIDDLKICLDTAHCMWHEKSRIKEYFELFKSRLVHLHISDQLKLGTEYRLHSVPGRGEISKTEWRYIFDVLDEIDFNGSATFEINPLSANECAEFALDYLRGLDK